MEGLIPKESWLALPRPESPSTCLPHSLTTATLIPEAQAIWRIMWFSFLVRCPGHSFHRTGGFSHWHAAVASSLTQQGKLERTLAVKPRHSGISPLCSARWSRAMPSSCWPRFCQLAISMFLGGAGGKEAICQCRRHETWVSSLGQEDPWRRAWQPTPVFLPGESHGQGSRAGYSPCSRKVSDMTEAT